MDCTVCMSVKKVENVSTCATCKDTGIICHDCIKQWAAVGNNPWVCTICKNPVSTMRNIPYSLYPDVSYVLTAIPVAVIGAQIRVMEQFHGFGWLVTLYGIFLLMSIAVTTFIFVYMSLLLFITAMRNCVISTEHLALAVENTVLTVEHLI
jgi:hypothetical protein